MAWPSAIPAMTTSGRLTRAAPRSIVRSGARICHDRGNAVSSRLPRHSELTHREERALRHDVLAGAETGQHLDCRSQLGSDTHPARLEAAVGGAYEDLEVLPVGDERRGGQCE